LSVEFQRRADWLLVVIADIAESADRLPALVEWLSTQVTDGEQRTVWLGVMITILLIMAVGLLARNLVLRLSPRPDPEHRQRSCIVRFAVEVVAAVVFGALTLGVLWIANFLASSYLIDLSLVARSALSLAAFLFVAMVWRALVRLLFGDSATEVGLLPLGDHPAELSRDSLVRIGRIGLIGSGFLIALNQLGLPEAHFLFLLHVLLLVVAGMAIVLVLRLKEIVANAIRTWNDESSAAIVRFVPGYFLARTWHYVAIVLIALHYLVWAFKVPGGIAFLSRATVSTLIILVIARFAFLGIEKLFASGASLGAEGQEFPSGVQERANRYAGPIRLLLLTTVTLIAFIAIATAWNTGVLDWLRSDTGKAFSGLVARLALVVGLTLMAIEITSLLAGRIVKATNDQGKPLHSNRVLTLTTILANILYFIVGLAGLFLALSQLGVETGPLLAGAGVVGLAVGFGSQALVKDLITGLFILLGDTIRVGDVVDVVGKSGVVEGMSMRTISLRSYDGNVHTIPYGSIDVVTNMTKEFSYALLDIEVAYKENTDDVIRVVREIDDRMRKEWPYRRLILEPIDIAGVNQFGNSAVAIRMRSKTRPGEQWGIRRELLRRIKLRFDELGIEIPYPHQTLYFGVGKDGTAPPLRIESLSRDLHDASDEPTREQDSQTLPLDPDASEPDVTATVGPVKSPTNRSVAVDQRRVGGS
jgi:small conductance mechanosensitive channel